jgi:hypothetical protein
MPRASHGINPVTFRGTVARNDNKPIAITIARMHVGFGDVLNKWVPVVLSKDDGSNEILGQVILDEDHFLGGMYHLFPIKGEMDHADLAPATVNDELIMHLHDAMTELQKLGRIESAKKIEALFQKYGF